MVIEGTAQFFRKFLRVAEVGDADAATRDLVFVSRADAATGGTDGALAGGLFAGLIQRDVVRHDDRRGRADLQAAAHFDAVGFEFADLLLQRAWVQHHAVADQAQRIGTQDAGGNQVEHGLLAADHQRVAGVVAALEADDGADILRQQIDDLALAFIAPLGAQHYD